MRKNGHIQNEKKWPINTKHRSKFCSFDSNLKNLKKLSIQQSTVLVATLKIRKWPDLRLLYNGCLKKAISNEKIVFKYDYRHPIKPNELR